MSRPCHSEEPNPLFIIYLWFSVEEYGKAHLVEPIPATKDQLATICYTSVGATNSIDPSSFADDRCGQGTTSDPKGQ